MVTPKFHYFECLALRVSYPISSVIVIAGLLSMLSLKYKYKKNSCLGVFNIQIDKNSRILKDLRQLMDFPTHNNGHTLDLINTKCAFTSLLIPVDLGLSDHLATLYYLYFAFTNSSLS